MRFFKNIIVFIILFSFSTIFAETQINLNLSKNKIDINEQLKLEVDIVIDPEDLKTELVINGLDDFDIIHQSRSQNMMIVNGLQTGSLKFNFILQAKQKGKYTIDISGNKKEIEVTGEKVIVGIKDDLMNYTEKDFKKEEKKEIKNLNHDSFDNKNISSTSSNTKELEYEKIIGINGEEMEDIYDIKEQFGILPFNIYYSLLYLIIATILYFIYRKYKLYLADKPREIILKRPKEIDYKKLIDSIEKEFLEKEKEVFYGNLGKFIRLYLDDKVSKGLSAKTLKEIKGYIKKDIYLLIEKIYFPEYDNKDDDIERRKEILKEINNKIIRNN